MLKAKLFSDNFFSRHNFIIEDTFLKIAKNLLKLGPLILIIQKYKNFCLKFLSGCP